ncbi:NAD-dependent protein deacetylase Sirt6 isoform X2 [Sitodiplosis mosellana]|uniref:NAD-dependent protein deacetylase Sirt6 isoform X2 n=1 Tax=Sitodiplosis mosellana TaxID=263140 RepID=UPI00244400C2|nr:NAD-dependent protein deacetylase Sirt6 isoform X2 [Sitodiplosis mosellana]
MSTKRAHHTELIIYYFHKNKYFKSTKMSCDYANGLSEYSNKGVLGIAEVFDDEKTVDEKCATLAQMILAAKHVVVHTGAGISTSSGIPDFRGPKGVWTLEKEGKAPQVNVSFSEAIPTKCHMALKALLDSGHIKYIISQNIDGLHLRSGVSRKHLAELHGNMFIENCDKCRRQYVRATPAPTVGQKRTGGLCKGGKGTRACRGGYLIDNILDWEHDLPDKDLDMALSHSCLADLNITLGTTLQINPAGTLPLKSKKFGGKVVICNLQPTKYDKKADLVISTYVDTVMEKVLKRLGVELPEYSGENDPTKRLPCDTEWTIAPKLVKEIDDQHKQMLKEIKKRKSDEPANVSKAKIKIDHVPKKEEKEDSE